MVSDKSNKVTPASNGARKSSDPRRNSNGQNPRKSVDKGKNPDPNQQEQQQQQKSIPKDELPGAEALAKKLELEKEKQLQREIERREKEFQLKLKHHQEHERKGTGNSEASIYVAPPAPINKISTILQFHCSSQGCPFCFVKLAGCGVRGFRNCLIICAVFILLALILQAIVIAETYIWPMGFATEFEKFTFVSLTIKLIAVSVITGITFLWLCIAVCFANTSPYCICRTSTHWFVRGYYAYSVYLLIFPLLFFLVMIVYLGRFNYYDLQENMETHLNMYDAVGRDTSKKFWDETQTYLECCGVSANGWKDWELRERVKEDIAEWIVPESCCIKNLSQQDLDMCVNATTDALVWKRGCAGPLFHLYNIFIYLVLLSLVVVMFFGIMSIYFATKVYEAIRTAQDPGFEFHIRTYFWECLCCCRRCRPVVLFLFG